MTALQKLLKHTHSAVFDVAPTERPAFRIIGPSSVTWSIADRVMTVRVDAIERDYDLSSYTVGQLAQRLVDDGLDIDAISSDFSQLSAIVLVDGSQSDNTGLVHAFTNLNWALLGAYAKELAIAGQQVIQAIRQMVIPQAETEWLDLHGKLYDQDRRPNQSDADYAESIPKEAFRARVNALAIEKAIFDATGKVVVIEEPWELLFRLSESQLSGSERFYDGDFVGPCLIQPTSRQPIDWSDVLPIIKRNKAAGVIVLTPFSRPSSFVRGGLAGNVRSSQSQKRVMLARQPGMWRLDFCVLSDELRPPTTRSFVTSLSKIMSSLGNVTPVSAQIRTYSFDSVTWLYAKNWGPFTWGSGPGVADTNATITMPIGITHVETDITTVMETEEIDFVIQDGTFTATTEWLSDGEFYAD